YGSWAGGVCWGAGSASMSSGLLRGASAATAEGSCGCSAGSEVGAPCSEAYAAGAAACGSAAAGCCAYGWWWGGVWRMVPASAVGGTGPAGGWRDRRSSRRRQRQRGEPPRPAGDIPQTVARSGRVDGHEVDELLDPGGEGGLDVRVGAHGRQDPLPAQTDVGPVGVRPAERLEGADLD